MYKGLDDQTCMNMIFQGMQEEQRTKRQSLISGRGKIKTTETKENKVKNFGDISEMLGPSVYYKLTSYDNIAAWYFLLAIVLARNNRRIANSCMIHHVSVCRCCTSWLEESGFLLQFIAFPQG